MNQNNPAVTDIKGIMNITGKPNAKFQKKQFDKLENYCGSLAEKMEIISHSPVQIHPIDALRNFSQFFKNMTAIFNSAIFTTHKIGIMNKKRKILSDNEVQQKQCAKLEK